MELAPKRWNGREDDIKRTSARFNDRDLVGTLSISTPRRSLLSTDSFSLPLPEGEATAALSSIGARRNGRRRTAKWRLAKFNDLNLAQIPSSLFFSSFFCSVSNFTHWANNKIPKIRPRRRKLVEIHSHPLCQRRVAEKEKPFERDPNFAKERKERKERRAR